MGGFIGFLMPEVDFARSTSLVNLLQKNSRKLEGISDYYGYRVLVARNLASVFAELHRAGHHMIDLKPANLRFYPAVSWMAVVDADGFSIAGANGRLGALQLSDEYIAPESWKRKPVELGVEQDLFALAGVIFQLLNNGVHPFAGTVTGSVATDLQTRIIEGLYPYAIAPCAGLTPSTASIHRMFRRTTREMFDAAFLTCQRPSAEQWRDHLDELVAQLVPCAARPGEHVHFGAGCGFCGHEARVQAVRGTPRRMAQPRRVVPPSPVPRPIHQPIAVLQAPRRRRTAASFTIRSSMLAAVIAGLIVASERLLQEIVARQAHAAALPKPNPIFEGTVAAFSEPHEYLILPRGDGERASLREGPGERYAALDSLTLSDELSGTGSTIAEGGARWIFVSRGDGASGFLPATELVAKGDVVAPLVCPAGRTCNDATVSRREDMIGLRYRELLGRSKRADRLLLEAGQRVWQAERGRCNRQERPVPCRIEASTRRMSALDAFAIGDRS
ncbi:MAG: hypothetical protein EOP61_10305 [Sphingomonadales bacterium]|nr:MAG: hypothetical protein EOP61_10305 [Sphingomonadales bacterium]